MAKWAYLAGSVYGFLGVALGAFGAHALEDVLLSNGYTDVYETGTRYHLVHALLLLGMGLMAERRDSKWLRAGTIAVSVGIPIFAGSLYLLSTLSLKWMGAITPVGGLLFLVGWASLFFHFFNSPKAQ